MDFLSQIQTCFLENKVLLAVGAAIVLLLIAINVVWKVSCWRSYGLVVLAVIAGVLAALDAMMLASPQQTTIIKYSSRYQEDGSKIQLKDGGALQAMLLTFAGEAKNFREHLQSLLEQQQKTLWTFAISGTGAVGLVLGVLFWHLNNIVDKSMGDLNKVISDSKTAAKQQILESEKQISDFVSNSLDVKAILGKASELAESRIRSNVSSSLSAETGVSLMAILAKTKMTLVERAESIAKGGGMIAALDPDDVNELVYSIERMMGAYIPQLQSQVLEFPSEWKIKASRQQALMATAVGVGEMAGPNPSNAERTLRMAIRLDSTLPEPHFFLGLFYLWRNAACEVGGSFGGLEKSLETLSFVEKISDNEGSLNEEARIMTGMYYVLKGDHENNPDLIDKGIEIYKSELTASGCNNERPHPQVLARMAMAYQLRSNSRKSFDLLIKALEIDPNYVRCKNILVWDSIRIKGDIKEELTLKPIIDFFESKDVALLNLKKWTEELKEHPFTSVSACISSTVMESLYILGDIEGAKEMAAKCLKLLRSSDPNGKIIRPRAEAILAGRAPHEVS